MYASKQVYVPMLFFFLNFYVRFDGMQLENKSFIYKNLIRPE